jgi:hypothetical protein
MGTLEIWKYFDVEGAGFDSHSVPKGRESTDNRQPSCFARGNLSDLDGVDTKLSTLLHEHLALPRQHQVDTRSIRRKHHRSRLTRNQPGKGDLPALLLRPLQHL